ncbi:MAG: sigma-70 family RNA polymerase sigma factor [Planktotalea sp.]|uniref:sigma-70 family RNA polymerase sigma factor n=1 Tax=Planktotalea sp. TaxID=2029877 RepID=UPI003C78A122
MNGLKQIEKWITQAALGDRSAFEALYNATSAKLFGICLRVLKDKTQAEEALQESYVKIWHHAGRYQINGLSPMSWLITIARNTAIDHLRAHKSGEVAAAPELMEGVADQSPGPEALLEMKSQSNQLALCLGELDSVHADVVRGAYLDGKTYAELALEADVPLNTMRTWLRRSLMKLRECLTR